MSSEGLRMDICSDLGIESSKQSSDNGRQYGYGFRVYASMSFHQGKG